MLLLMKVLESVLADLELLKGGCHRKMNLDFFFFLAIYDNLFV